MPGMDQSSARNPSVSQLIAEAFAIEMERDEKIVLLGEDIGELGGVFGTTRGLQQRFGNWRVRDTPISEMAFTGMGVGLAMAGYRPVVEIMFVDFIGVCLEQVMNAMSKIPYMSGGNVRIPMVVKTAGGSIGSAAQHSQCLWGTFAHLPGMYVVTPSCPRDYKGLMAAALECDSPVVYIEHKSQLNRKANTFVRSDPGPEGRFTTPIGKAEVARPGGDVTVVAISAAAEWSLQAADTVAAEGIDAEVIDLRSIVPMDMPTLLTSISRTGRLLIVDEDFRSFGVSGEIIARAVEELGPGALKQVVRNCMPDVPLPAAKTLEDAVMPGPASIAAALRQMAARS
jgi:pyruvate dehydrogenase E1 component beta subunit